MKLRAFLLLVAIMLAGYWGHQIYTIYWPYYKEMRWKASPMYNIRQHFARHEALQKQAKQKYLLTFKDHCKKFGGDMKLLKQIKDNPNFDAPFKEHLKLKLYYQQFILFEQWLTYDRILFPYTYDLQMSTDYYRNIKPRLT